MILQDDPRVVHPRSEAELREALTEIKALGTDRLRVTVLWNLIAPDPRSEQRPSFDATDPRSYPPGVWDRYDRIVRMGEELGLGVLFTVSGPGPAWADQSRTGRAGITRPDPVAFGDFVEAVGRRYSGEWPDPAGAPASGATLPRVGHWSIYNEPNFPGWLMPQFSRGRPVSPHLYRGLVDGAWEGLEKSGHRTDTILLGETARFADPPPRKPARVRFGGAHAHLRARAVLPVRALPPAARAAQRGRAGAPPPPRGAGASGPITRRCSVRRAGPTTPTRSPASPAGAATGAPTP